MAFSVKPGTTGSDGKPLFVMTGTGGNSAFQPLIGDPRLSKSYLSWMVNQKPALTGFALKATIERIRATRGGLLGAKPGVRDVVQLDRADGTKYKSHDGDWTRFQSEVQARLTAEVPLGIHTKWGVTGSGVARDWSKLSTSGAIAMNPSLTPRFSDIGRAPSPIPDDYLELLGWVTEIYSEVWTPRSITQNNTSYSGILADTHSKGEKIDFFINKIVRPHGFTFVQAMNDFDGDWFVRHFKCAPVTYTTYRWQLDVLDKVRGGFDYLGAPVDASDKSVPKEYANGFERMTAARQRTAYAVDGMSSFVTAPYFVGIRYNAMNNYPKTWHTAHGEDLTDPIVKYGHFRLEDAKEFDSTFDRIEIDKITNSLLHIPQSSKDYITAVSHLPIVIKSDRRGESGAYLFNNNDYAAGHQSGVQWVSDYNKIRGTAHWLYGLVKIGYIDMAKGKEFVIDLIKTILKHDDDHYALINQGDDTMALSSSESDLNAWCAAVESIDFAVWEPDSGKKMIGYVFYQDTVGSPLRTIPDAVTLVEKLIINERSVHSVHRKLSSVGNLDRLHQLATKIKAGPSIIRILDECALKHFGSTMEDLYLETLRFDNDAIDETGFDFKSLNAATIAFILDPDVIHHKVDKDDVDPRVFNAYFSTISEEDTCWVLKRTQFMLDGVHPALDEAANDPNYELAYERDFDTWRSNNVRRA